MFAQKYFILKIKVKNYLMFIMYVLCFQICAHETKCKREAWDHFPVFIQVITGLRFS